MSDEERSKDQLIKELHQRIEELEKLETEHNRVEEALRESERELSAIFNSTKDGVLLLDKTGKIIKMNKEITEIGGYAGKDVIGKRFNTLKFFTSKSLSKMTVAFAKIMVYIEVPPFEVELKTKDGKKSYLEIYVSPVEENGEIVGSISILRDITKRKRAEEMLKVSEEKYRDLFENAYDVIWTADARGRYTSINKMFEKSLGYKRGELIGKQSLKLVAEEDRGKSIQIYEKTLDGEPQSYELKIKTKNGNTRIFTLRTRPIRENESIIGIQGIARDITERKKAEQQREKARKESEFYADVLAHDIGNINQITLGYLYLLQKAKDKKTKEKNVDSIRKSVMKSGILTGRIKALKEIEDTKTEKFDLNRSIERSIEKIKAYFDKEIKVNLDMNKHYYVKANDFLDKVFFNILENSVEFTFQDKVIIDIKTEEKDGFCNIHIHDNGFGISKEKREDILENLETLSKRTGMGLYLVKKILDRFNGKFEIKDVKKGTEIVVTLPVVGQNGGSARSVHPQRSHKRNERKGR